LAEAAVMTIYNVINDFYALKNLINEAMTDLETGEVRELTDEERADFLAWLQENEQNFETKFNNTCKVLKNLEAQADIAKAEKDALNAEIDRFRKKEKARLNEVARVKSLIIYAFDKMKMKKYKTPLFNAYFQATKKSAKPAVGFFKPDNIPVEFLKQELSPSAIDNAVKEVVPQMR
jgi:hypothetical protein